MKIKRINLRSTMPKIAIKLGIKRPKLSLPTPKKIRMIK